MGLMIPQFGCVVNHWHLTQLETLQNIIEKKKVFHAGFVLAEGPPK